MIHDYDEKIYKKIIELSECSDKTLIDEIMGYTEDDSCLMCGAEVKNSSEFCSSECQKKWEEESKLEETSTTGGAPGFMTPNAFTAGRPSDKKKLSKNVGNYGYSVVNKA